MRYKSNDHLTIVCFCVVSSSEWPISMLTETSFRWIAHSRDIIIKIVLFCGGQSRHTDKHINIKKQIKAEKKTRTKMKVNRISVFTIVYARLAGYCEKKFNSFVCALLCALKLSLKHFSCVYFFLSIQCQTDSDTVSECISNFASADLICVLRDLVI